MHNVLSEQQNIKTLVSSFLLKIPVDIVPFRNLVGADLIDQLSSLGFVFKEKDKIISKISITPIGERYFLNDGQLVYPGVDDLIANGTLILFHTPINPITSWEGAKRFYSDLEFPANLPDGYLMKDHLESAHFNVVCWGVIAYVRSGKPGFFKIENTATDGRIIEAQKLAHAKNLVGF